jgi:hypothetical protein
MYQAHGIIGDTSAAHNVITLKPRVSKSIMIMNTKLEILKAKTKT